MEEGERALLPAHYGERERAEAFCGDHVMRRDPAPQQHAQDVNAPAPDSLEKVLRSNPYSSET